MKIVYQVLCDFQPYAKYDTRREANAVVDRKIQKQMELDLPVHEWKCWKVQEVKNWSEMRRELDEGYAKRKADAMAEGDA